MAHVSLRWKFLAKLRSFTVRTEAEAALPTVSGTLRNIRPRDPVDDSPQCKSRWAVSPIVSDVFASVMLSTVITSVTLSSGTAPSSVSLTSHSLYGGRPPLIPVSEPLSRFANRDCVSSSIQSDVAATRACLSSPGSHASTVCVNLDVFTSEGSGSSDGGSPVSLVARDRVSACSVKSVRMKRPMRLVN